MIKQSIDDQLPEGAKGSRVINGELHVFFEGDQEVIRELSAIAKINKHRELLSDLASAIKSGYTSSATGEELSYSLNSEDMNDLSGLIELGNVSGKYRAGNSKRFVAHTLQQLKQVRDDGVAYKYVAYEKLEALQDQITAATTVEEIEAITW